ncbi:MAG TPA: serine hydrolase, partial [Thermoleophilaceae bacterium]|nr:serine hydrolase [Thermoleophilaceae bacterium]
MARRLSGRVGPMALICVLAAAAAGAAGAAGADRGARLASGPERPPPSASALGPAAFPPEGRIRAAQRWVRARRGLNSLALIDSHGREHGVAPQRVYRSASVVKALMLVSYLRRIGNRLPRAAERALLGPMITRSDNGAATAIYRRVGGESLRRLARRAGMRRFSVFVRWSSARFSALDQARFFAQIDALIPARSRLYARRLLSSIVPRQRWGFSRPAAAAGFKAFFKGGWRGTRLGQL